MVVQVLIPLPLAGPYDYETPPTIQAKRGDHVIVPLGPRKVRGVVWGPSSAEIDPKRLKSIETLLEAPPLPEALCDFIDWVAAYTLSAPGSVLALALRAPGALEPPKMRSLYRLTERRPEKMTAARVKVFAVAEDGLPRASADLAREAGVSDGVVRGLIAADILQHIEVPEDNPFPEPDPSMPGKALSPDQSAAAAALSDAVEARVFSPILLDGVTGSGKTEVYFEAVAATLKAGRQVLILLPEIALTVQFLKRFEARFGCPPAEWHSDISQKERRRTWRMVAEGQVRVVVGARSALFLPYSDLGLIIVDEEHESAFKQEEGVLYNARDMAVVRARTSSCPIVLASATPSLETMVNADDGRYQWVRLTARAGAAQMPSVEAVDMRADPPPDREHWISPVLIEAMKQTFEQGEQALLFLNRRGYAPLVICRACGHRMTAPDTASWLVEHKYQNRLVCHQTGYSIPKPKTCPACNEPDTLHSCGPGVERVAEEAAELFPDIRTMIMSSDTISRPSEAQALVEAMANRQIDLLIGTQMVAKGHHFPLLTLVGVVDADLGLHGGDLRAAERTYQVLNQVAGRAGRAERPGRVLLQTYMPEHKVMAALLSGDRDAFMAAEAEDREVAGYPPFGRLAAVIVSSPDQAAAHDTARALARAAPSAQGVIVLGPAPAPIALLRGNHRLRFLVKTAKAVNLQAFMRAWMGGVKTSSKVRVAVDIDPYSFL